MPPLIAHIAAVCVEARQSVSRDPLDVQLAFQREYRPQIVKTIQRFEMGETWPHDPDQTVRAYARVAGVSPADLWRRAVNRWAAELAEALGEVPEAPGMESGKGSRPSAKTSRARGSRAAE